MEKSEPERTGDDDEKAQSLVARVDARLRSYGIDVGDHAIGVVLAGGAVALSLGLVAVGGRAFGRALPVPRSFVLRLGRGVAGLVAMNVARGLTSHYALVGATALGEALAKERAEGRRRSGHKRWRVPTN